MKKLLAVFMAVLLGISATCTAWAASLSDVGIVGEQIPSRFLGKEALLTQKFQQAFQWAAQLHAHESEELFDFGQPTGEYMHAWSGTEDENAYQIVIQDFYYGNSTARNGWAGLLCADENTCEVVILRDAPAEYYLAGGGVNNLEFGDPTTNQYWRVEYGVPVLYQQFTNGYYRAEEGKAYLGKFHSYIAEGYAYVEPPAAPPAYGDIYEANQDGCTWEHPDYIPQADTSSSPSSPASIIDPVIEPIIEPPLTSTPTGSAPTSSRENAPQPGGSLSSSPAGSGSGTSSDAASQSPEAALPQSQLSPLSSEQAVIDAAPGTTGAAVRTLNVNMHLLLLAVLGGVCVLAAGAGIFCLYWFVLRDKKKPGDPPKPPGTPPGLD